MPVTLDAELAIVGAVGAGEPDLFLRRERRGEGGGDEREDEDRDMGRFHVEKIGDCLLWKKVLLWGSRIAIDGVKSVVFAFGSNRKCDRGDLPQVG